jgi:hypothetical protein
MSPSYVGESTPSSDETNADAKTCLRAALPAEAFAVEDRARVLFDGWAWTDTADAPLSVSGSLSSSDASYAGESMDGAKDPPCGMLCM